jgi:DNA-binding MarR family transcriptional regulator
MDTRQADALEQTRRDSGLMSPDIRFNAWYGALQASLRALDRIGQEFEQETGMPLAWYEVLIRAYKKPDQRVRMGDLASTLLLSRGGATRLVARMEEAGLVTREIPPEDRRATYAVLTEKGREAAQAGLPLHLESVQRHFGDAITDDEAEVILRASVKVLAAVGQECAWLVNELGECTCEDGRECVVHGSAAQA